MFIILMNMQGIKVFAAEHEIAVPNADGVAIYYNWINDHTELEVTYNKGNPDQFNFTKSYRGNVAIPESVNYQGHTYNVTSIGTYAFFGCIGLISVVIPDGVTYIGQYAFSGCSDLKSIIIPNSVKLLDAYAFLDCKNLTSIFIPNSVTTLEDGVFQRCEKLSSINIPNSVTTIGISAFAETLWYDNQPDGLVYAGEVFYKYKGYMPDNTHITINDGTLGIASGAFRIDYNPKGLSSITIPYSVKSIGKSAFQRCSGLSSVVIPDGVKSIGRSTFEGCSGLSSVIIPDGVTDIGSSAFSGCISLKSITIPNSVTTIRDFAFRGCNNLKTITIPNSVTTIGISAFAETSWYDNQPNGLVYVGEVLYTYKGDMPVNTQIILKDGTLGIAGGAFQYCDNLTSITIPNSVKSIGESAFKGCSGLSSIIIPDGVTYIGPYAFNKCTSLTSFDIPSGITLIGMFVFDECTSLQSVIIPSSVVTMGDDAFRKCTNLTSITIPPSVTSIESGAFFYCSSLTDFYCYANYIPKTLYRIFEYSNLNNATLHVPAALIELYRLSTFWNKFKNIVALADEDPKPMGMHIVTTENYVYPIGTYTIGGRYIPKPQHGLNIIRMSDGTVKKMIVK